MRFPYIRRDTPTPILSLGNVSYRYRPMVDIQLIGPGRLAQFYRATLDTGADDTVFPSSVAADLGIDLSNTPEHDCDAVGGHRVLYRYAEAELRLTDGNEMFVWNAIVGFGETVKRPILGHAGVMQYFDIDFLGRGREVIMSPIHHSPVKARTESSLAQSRHWQRESGSAPCRMKGGLGLTPFPDRDHRGGHRSRGRDRWRDRELAAEDRKLAAESSRNLLRGVKNSAGRAAWAMAAHDMASIRSGYG